MGRRDAVAIFLVVGAASLLTTSGSLRSADYVVAFSVAANLVDHGSLQATPIRGFEAWAVSTGADGRPYCRYGLGHSLLGVPARVLAHALAATGLDPAPALDLPLVRFDAPDEPLQAWSGFFAAQVNAAVLGMLAVTLLHLSSLLWMSRRAALMAALLGTLGSPLFFQASDFTAEPASALALALCALGLLRIERDGATASRSLAVGLAAGATVLLKVAHGVLLVPATVAFLLATRPGARRCVVLAYALGLAIPLALVAGYNQARFHDPLETGYGAYALEFTNPFLEGLAGQMVSPGRGLLLHVPAAVLAFAGLGRLWQCSRSVAVLSVGSLVSLWFLYAPWFAWDGGWTYGPRLLSPATALLALPAILALRGDRRAWFRAVAVVVLAGSFAASFLGFAVDDVDYHFYLWRLHGDRTTFVSRWSLWDAPLVAYWGFPLRRGLALLGALRAGGPWPLFAWFGASVVAAVAGFALLLRPEGARCDRPWPRRGWPPPYRRVSDMTR